MSPETQLDRMLARETARQHGDEYRARLVLIGHINERRDGLRKTRTYEFRVMTLDLILQWLMEPILPRLFAEARATGWMLPPDYPLQPFEKKEPTG